MGLGLDCSEASGAAQESQKAWVVGAVGGAGRRAEKVAGEPGALNFVGSVSSSSSSTGWALELVGGALKTRRRSVGGWVGGGAKFLPAPPATAVSSLAGSVAKRSAEDPEPLP